MSPATGAILNPDFLDLLTAFNVADVRYMVVGAYAVAEHGLDDLLKNKRAAARPQDLADVDALERLHGASSR